MSKRFFTGLVIMMALSIIGITWVQINWIKNAVEILNQDFNNRVFNSLNNAAGEIESLRKMNFFNNLGSSAPLISSDSSGKIEGYVSFGSYTTQGGGGFSININNKTVPLSQGDPGGNINNQSVSSEIKGNGNDSVTLIIDSLGNQGKIRIVQNGQSSSLRNVPDYIHQKEYLEWVKKRSDEFRHLSNQMINEIYEWEKTMELDNNEIGNSLHQSLYYYGINAPFEFAVLKDGVVGEGT